MKKIIPILCFSLILFSVSCAVNPVTGKRELSLISEEGEISLGKETDVQIREQYGIYDDSDLLVYVQRVGQTMTLHTHRPQPDIRFPADS